MEHPHSTIGPGKAGIACENELLRMRKGPGGNVDEHVLQP